MADWAISLAITVFCKGFRGRHPPPGRGCGLPDHDQRLIHRADDDRGIAMAGVFAPEPLRDPPPYRESTRYRYPRDPLSGQAETGDTEMSWGEGLVAPHANGTAPRDGGQYMPKCPRVDPPRSGVGRPRQHRSPRGEARGYPGDRIAR